MVPRALTRAAMGGLAAAALAFAALASNPAQAAPFSPAFAVTEQAEAALVPVQYGYGHHRGHRHHRGYGHRHHGWDRHDGWRHRRHHGWGHHHHGHGHRHGFYRGYDRY